MDITSLLCCLSCHYIHCVSVMVSNFITRYSRVHFICSNEQREGLENISENVNTINYAELKYLQLLSSVECQSQEQECVVVPVVMNVSE